MRPWLCVTSALLFALVALLVGVCVSPATPVAAVPVRYHASSDRHHVHHQHQQRHAHGLRAHRRAASAQAAHAGGHAAVAANSGSEMMSAASRRRSDMRQRLKHAQWLAAASVGATVHVAAAAVDTVDAAVRARDAADADIVVRDARAGAAAAAAEAKAKAEAEATVSDAAAQAQVAREGVDVWQDPERSLTFDATVGAYRYPNYENNDKGDGWPLTAEAAKIVELVAAGVRDGLSEPRMVGVAIDANHKLYWAVSGDDEPALSGASVAEIQKMDLGGGAHVVDVTFVKGKKSSDNMKTFIEAYGYKLGVYPRKVIRSDLSLDALTISRPKWGKLPDDEKLGPERVLRTSTTRNAQFAKEYDAAQRYVQSHPPLQLNTPRKATWGPPEKVDGKMVDERNAAIAAKQAEMVAILAAAKLTKEQLMRERDKVEITAGGVFGTCAGSKLAFYRSLHGLTYTAFAERWSPANGKLRTSCETCAVVIPPIMAHNTKR